MLYSFWLLEIPTDDLYARAVEGAEITVDTARRMVSVDGKVWCFATHLRTQNAKMAVALGQRVHTGAPVRRVA